MDDGNLDALLHSHYAPEVERLASGAKREGCLSYGRLEGAARREVLKPDEESHLASCGRCAGIRAAFVRELGPRPPRAALAPAWDGLRRLGWRVQAASLALVALLIAFTPGLLRQGGPVDSYAELIRGATLPPAELEAASIQFLTLWAGTASRGSSDGEHRPNGEAYLPNDPIEFELARPDLRGEYVLHLKGRDEMHVKGAHFTAPPPRDGWPSGSHDWSVTTPAGDHVANGSFLVLRPPAPEYVARAKRDLEGQRLRLAKLYYLLRLDSRRDDLLRPLSEPERQDVLKRLPLSEEEQQEVVKRLAPEDKPSR